MGGKDRSLICIVARNGLLAFVAVFVVFMPSVSSAVILPEANNTSLVLEYYYTARRIFFVSFVLSGFNIVYALKFVNRKSLSSTRKRLKTRN